MPPCGMQHMAAVLPSHPRLRRRRPPEELPSAREQICSGTNGISSADGHRAFLAIIASSGSCADLRNSLRLTDSITSGSPHIILGDLAVRLGRLAARSLSQHYCRPALDGVAVADRSGSKAAPSHAGRLSLSKGRSQVYEAVGDKCAVRQGRGCPWRARRRSGSGRRARCSGR
jgi:hypothetical protein